MDSLVSIIIPCYNDRDNLPRAVKSALSQRYLHEIILVDDQSTDDSLAIAESLCELDPRIAVFSSPRNQGPGQTRNFGAQFASGLYLAFLDSDDEYLPNFLEMTVGALQENPGMLAVKTSIEFLNPPGLPALSLDDPRNEALIFSSSSNVVLHREAFEKVGGYPSCSTFRGAHGGEDVAFNKALAKYLDPLGRLYEVGYRAWNKPGSHLDKFLANTRVIGNAFEFITLSDAQQPGGALESAIDAYLDEMAARFNRSAADKSTA